MHSNTAVLLLALSAVTPALSAPISLGSLGAEIAKGLASGGALAGIVAGIDKLDGSSSTTTSKREFSEEDFALLKRAVSLGDLGTEIAKGLASGGALAGIVAGIDKLDGSSSTTTSKREFSDEDIALLRRAVSLGDLGKEIAQGLASGGALAGVTAAIDKLDGSSSTTTTSKREPLSLGSLGKGLLGAGASLVTSSVVGDVIDDVTGQSSKREAVALTSPREAGHGLEIFPSHVVNDGQTTSPKIAVRGLLSSIVDDADSVITKGIVGGVASGIAGSVVGDIVGSKRETVELPQLKGAGHGPEVFPDGVAALKGESLTKREMEVRSLLSKLLGAGSSLVSSSVVGDIIDDVTKREPLSLGSLEKGLLGAGASLVTSGVVGDVIDDVTGQSSKRETITLPPTLGLGLGPAVLSPDVVALDGESLTKREVEARSLLGSIIDDADSVITKGIVGGVASGIAGSVVSDIAGSKREPFTLDPTITRPPPTPAECALLEGKATKRGALVLPGSCPGPIVFPEDAAAPNAKSTKREVEARGLLSSIVDDADSVITKGIVGGVASGIAGSVVGDIVGSKRETVEVPKLVTGGLSPEVISKGLPSLNGEPLTKREMEVRSLLSKLLGAGSSLVSSSVVGDIINDVTKRDVQLTPEEKLYIALLHQVKSSKRSINDLD